MDSKTYISKFTATWLGRLVSRLSIAKKISYGYALAIGIAVLGTTIGLGIGDYYQKRAEKQANLADKQQELISDLEQAVDDMRSHPQKLVTVLGESIWFDYERAKFLTDVNQVNKNVNKFESFINSHPENLASNATELKDLLKNYETTTKYYSQLIQLLWQQIDPASLKAEEIITAQQLLWNFLRGKEATDVSVKFDRLTESLDRIKDAAEIQQKQSEERLEEAQRLRQLIIAASMMLSVAIAVALAAITSRAIAHPLEAVTQVARAIAQDSNFTLRSPVTTEDEVGLLATSLNQLVQRVEEYTRELEVARQTLEQRVEERTQELTQAIQRLQQTQSQLIQTEKMSSLGKMVAGIAHEINNPVNFIHGNLEYANQYAQDLLNLVNLYQQQYPLPTPLIEEQIKTIDLLFIKEDLPKLLVSIKTGSERIRKIVLSLRKFSRLDEAQIKTVDIHEGIDNTLLLLNHRLKQEIEVIKNYDDLPLIECYPAQLNQVFMHVITNAIDAVEEVTSKSSLVIANGKKSSNHPLPMTHYQSPTIQIRTEMNSPHYVTVRIRDNGPGIPTDIKHRLFDPFFTTKPVGKGTGLGLSISYQIIEKHRGQIEVTSEPGSGTEFAIALPINQIENGS